MELQLHIVRDADNVIGKTLDPNPWLMDIFLKRDVDISSPVLRLSSPLGNGFNGWNYAYIPLLGRYYFIDSIENIGGELWELRLRCDVLETYKPDILSSMALFSRKIQNGDCVNVNVDTCVYKTISRYQSDRELEIGSSLILTTIGSK